MRERALTQGLVGHNSVKKHHLCMGVGGGLWASGYISWSAQALRASGFASSGESAIKRIALTPRSAVWGVLKAGGGVSKVESNNVAVDNHGARTCTART